MENEITTVSSAQPTVTLVAKESLPKADSLSKQDLVKWGRDTFIFSVPAILAVLLALQSGLDYKVALGMGIQALIASAISLLSKYKAGV